MAVPSKRLVLQTPAGGFLGFVLLAPDQTGDSGDCIFMVLPRDPALWNTAVFRWLRRRGHEEAGEHAFSLGEDGSIRIWAEGFELILRPGQDGHLAPAGCPVAFRATWNAPQQPSA